jgi:SEC-C motif
MTLILVLGNSDQMIQVSDRRLSWHGHLVEDESSKAGLLTCLNARLAFGFTGLAKFGNFCTRDWLLDALMDSGPPEYTAKEVLERLKIRASDTFRRHPALHLTHRALKRLSIMFSGYLDHHTPPLAAFAILTNYQNFDSGQDEAEASDEFRLRFASERRPLDGELTFIQRVGNWRAMTRDDELALRRLLRDRKPSAAIIGKAVKLIRQMADRPAANNSIGKQLSVISIPRDPVLPVESGYYSAVNSSITYMPDNVLVKPHETCAAKDIRVRKVQPAGSPLLVPKVGRNHPCPCGSGKKYKRCHGRLSSAPRVSLPNGSPPNSP